MVPVVVGVVVGVGVVTAAVVEGEHFCTRAFE